MNAILICPAERSGLSRLIDAGPLATVPILGGSLVEHWLEHVAAQGAKTVRLLASDRPGQVLERTGDGARWGLRVELTPTRRELTVEEARVQYRQDPTQWLTEPNDVVLLEHLPGASGRSLLDNYSSFFNSIVSWFLAPGTQSATGSLLRVGMREVRPGLWVSSRCHIASSAKLHPPCWVGHQVWIGAKSVIGPGAVIEERAFIESGATVSQSFVSPETFVGKFARLQNSLAYGSTLIDWRTGESIEVAEPFLLCALRQHRTHPQHARWLGRLAAMKWIFPTPAIASSSVGDSEGRN